jgi:hypothetical protein
MNYLLATLLFFALIALLYFLLLSERSIIMHRVRSWQSRHDEMDRELRDFSEAKHTRSTAIGHNSSAGGESTRNHSIRERPDAKID